MKNPNSASLNKEDSFSDEYIQNVLLRIGIPANLQGFQYTVYAEKLIKENHEYMYQVTKCLYVMIARKYNTTPGRVERAIRHAIHAGCSQNKNDFVHNLFLNSISSETGLPTNSQFLARVFYYLEAHEDEYDHKK